MSKKTNLIYLSLLFLILQSCSFGGAKPCFELKCTSLTQMDLILQGEDVLLSNCSDDGIAFSWDFGDGENSTLNSPHHIWETPGTYTVTLTVETEKNSKSTSQEVVISPSLYGNWVGECQAESNSIPISFILVQEGSRIKGEFRYGASSQAGAITSHSEIVEGEVKIICSYVSVFFFDGEEYSNNSMFTFEGSVNESKTMLQGDHFKIRDTEYGSWSVTKQ